jgi:hypothetical protein
MRIVAVSNIPLIVSKRQILHKLKGFGTIVHIDMPLKDIRKESALDQHRLKAMKEEDNNRADMRYLKDVEALDKILGFTSRVENHLKEQDKKSEPSSIFRTIREWNKTRFEKEDYASMRNPNPVLNPEHQAIFEEEKVKRLIRMLGDSGIEGSNIKEAKENLKSYIEIAQNPMGYTNLPDMTTAPTQEVALNESLDSLRVEELVKYVKYIQMNREGINEDILSE